MSGGITTRRWVFIGLAALVLIGLSSAIDPWAYHHVQMRGVYDTDWGRAFRSVGYWPIWIVVALACWLERPEDGTGLRRASVLVGSVTLAGLLGEVLKLVIRRQRPGIADGAYSFRAWSDRPFSSAGFGLPSSHALIAFSAAAALTRLFPRAAPIWYALAIGCGVTRVLAGAHFVSDVIVGALLGIATSVWLSRRLDARAPRPGAVT
jgi:membrane-associated phospholipid phosphatase